MTDPVGRAQSPGPASLCHRRGAPDADQPSDLPKGMMQSVTPAKPDSPTQEGSEQKVTGPSPRGLAQSNMQWLGQNVFLGIRAL